MEECGSLASSSEVQNGRGGHDHRTAGRDGMEGRICRLDYEIDRGREETRMMESVSTMNEVFD